jgi:hypothetical protein
MRGTLGKRKTMEWKLGVDENFGTKEEKNTQNKINEWSKKEKKLMQKHENKKYGRK